MVGGLRCVVIQVKCDRNRLRGYGAVVVENGPFLLLWPVAYTTACTTVQAVMLSIWSSKHVVSRTDVFLGVTTFKFNIFPYFFKKYLKIRAKEAISS